MGDNPKLWGTQDLVLSYAWVFYITCDQREPNTIYFKGDINNKGNMCVWTKMQKDPKLNDARMKKNILSKRDQNRNKNIPTSCNNMLLKIRNVYC